VDWWRAASLLYGDWGTSKAYVIGLAFAATGFSSLPIILAVCCLTAVVAYNYVVICRHFPDGGGVYSAARNQSRLLAVTGALLLVANFTVTAAMSAWAAMSYFGIPRVWIPITTMLMIAAVGFMNRFGPKHTGSLAMSLAVPMVLLVVLVVGWSLPFLGTQSLEPLTGGLRSSWVAFTGVILALSGVEAVANLTGVMRLDRGATPDEPRVGRTALKSILPVAAEVVIGTALLGWAMLSLPQALGQAPVDLAPLLNERRDDMLRLLAESYGGVVFGPGFGRIFGVITGVVVGLLLLSAVNTAIGALIGLYYMMARDGEMPRAFTRLNAHGVPWLPLASATVLPILVVAFSSDLESLAGLYAIGVVGAIAVNLGACTFNQRLPLAWWDRVILGITFLTLFAVELTIAKNKPDALFFACCVVGGGLGLRGYAQRRAGLRTVTVSEQVAAAMVPESVQDFNVELSTGQSILVAARGLTPVLHYAIEEAHLRNGTLYVLYVKEVAVNIPGPIEHGEKPKWGEDPQARTIMLAALEAGRKHGIPVMPIYVVSDAPATTILDLAATLGIDALMLGTPHRSRLVSLLKGNVVTEVARNLPENIRLIIYS
jgi:amino acid transporter/nucleotide-binding universal stress UspA family protein